MVGFQKNNFAKLIITLLIFIFVTLVFQVNFLGFAHRGMFEESMRSSEALIVGSIVADQYHLDKGRSNIGFVGKSKEFIYPDNIYDSYDILGQGAIDVTMTYKPYLSQYGLQGIFYSWLYKTFNIDSLELIQIAASASTVFVLMLLSYLYRDIYDRKYAIIFFITLASSPWIVTFARNLYWSIALWFIPAIFAALLYRQTNTYNKLLLLLCIMGAIAVKSLSGYEFLTTITLFAISIFIVGPYFDSSSPNPSPNYKMAAAVFVACIIGFLIALLMHASLRSDNLIRGVMDIYEQDVRRRTYGDPNQFSTVYKDSLESSLFTVIKIYLINWSTPIAMWVNGKLFIPMIALSIIGIRCKFLKGDFSYKRELILLSIGLVAPISWFVLAKAHSYIHTHINFILWYIGFVPALTYVFINTCGSMWKCYIKQA